jgi:hypothetical protein
MRHFHFAGAFFGLAAIQFLSASSQGQDLSLIGKTCPADTSTYSLENGNRECNPDDEKSQACDRHFKAPSKEWTACYDKIAACRQEVDENNSKISSYNNWIYQCRDADRKRTGSAQTQPKTPSNGLSERLKQAEERNQQKQQSNGAEQDQFKSRIDQNIRQNDLADERAKFDADVKTNEKNRAAEKLKADAAREPSIMPKPVRGQLTKASAAQNVFDRNPTCHKVEGNFVCEANRLSDVNIPLFHGGCLAVALPYGRMVIGEYSRPMYRHNDEDPHPGDTTIDVICVP